MRFTQQMLHGMKIIRLMLFMSKLISDCGLTISKSLSNIILHFQYTGPIELGGIRELTLVRAACQLTEEVHQIEETCRTPVQRRYDCHMSHIIEKKTKKKT